MVYFIPDVGEVFTFGEGDGGKLGQGTDYGKAVAPKKVNIPEKAKSVACGGSHTVVLTGKVLNVFGRGKVVIWLKTLKFMSVNGKEQ